MSLTGNKGTTPFKTVDIKSALMSAGNRKRKASPSEVLSGAKNVRLSLDNEEDNEVEIIDEVCGKTVKLDQNTLNISSDCKENKDINSSNADKGILELISVTDNNASNINTEDTHITINIGPQLSSLITIQNKPDEMEVSDSSNSSDNSSHDEQNTSPLSNSVNVSLNISGTTGDELETTIEYSKEVNKSPVNTQKKIITKDKAKKKKMTPVEAKKRAEIREEKQKEKLLKKQEMETKKLERLLEKERKAKEKQLRKEREEVERKERERLKQEKKEQEEKERLMKQKEKEEKLQKKLEEQKKKEILKQKKEEEMKKAEGEKLKKEQKEKEKAERAKAAFVKFFIKGDTSVSTSVTQVLEKEGAFLPFQVSDDMILAPVVPPAAQERFDRKQLDNYLQCQDGKELYLQNLKCGSNNAVRQRKRVHKLTTTEADVIVIDKSADLSLRAKLLQFSENVRPPYWGTWRKKSNNIRPRNPFGQDEIFDYSVDSDDEWDEGGPGESLSGTEPEDESEDDYEVDNEFFVPHGYLSDEEKKIEDDDEEVNKDPEKQKDLLKKKLQEFEMEHKRKTTELKPIILGCYFSNDPEFQDPGIQIFLQNYTAELITDSSIPTRFTYNKQQTFSNLSESPKSSSNNIVKRKKKSYLVPEEAMPHLIRFVHGNIRNRNVLAKEFQKLWTEQNNDSSIIKPETSAEQPCMEICESKSIFGELKNSPVEPDSGTQMSLMQLKVTIKGIATYGKPPKSSINKCCWWVHESIREKYGLIDAPFPNDKSYVSFPALEDKQLCSAKGVSIKEFLSLN